MKNKMLCLIICVIIMLATIPCQTCVCAARISHPDEIQEVHACIFTGYYPDDSRLEGGYRAYNMEWLDPSDYTCAAPEEIPIGSIVTVHGTGNFRDGRTYRVNDRGGKIRVIDGIYHIDILMMCKEQCDRFGVQKGYITVTRKEK